MNDTINRENAIGALERIFDMCEEIDNHLPEDDPDRSGYKMLPDYMTIWRYLSEQPEIIRCKDCKFYTPMNRETKTEICNLTMHQNFGDNWFCAGAERRTDG